MELDDLQNSGGEELEVECSLVSRGPDPDGVFFRISCTLRHSPSSNTFKTLFLPLMEF